ncbi:MAG: pilus assembly protein PilM [Candidatus Omnitrophota bacterium]|jgi:Tfp pilus assembly PilM family ATPase
MLVSKDLVAIDISGFDLKIAQMSLSPTKREILDFATQDIENLSEEDIAKAIKQTLKKFQISRPRVLAVIPSFLTITKNIEIPSRNPEEIKEIINLQASRHTPYSRDEIIIDYVNIGTYKQNYSKVLLVIATRSLIRRQLEILDKAQLSVERMLFAPEGTSYILSKSLKLSHLDSPVGIIHIDQGFTDFIISYMDKVIFIRNIPIGTQHLLEEKEKYEPKFVGEVRKSLEAYTGEDIERVPKRFLFTGAIDKLKHLTDILNSNLRIQAESLIYSEHLSLSQKATQATSMNNNLSFLNAAACLLANEEIKLDLVPEEMKLEKSLKQRGREIIKAGILAMAAFVLIYCTLISRVYIKSSYFRNLSSRYASIHNEAEELEESFKKNQTISNVLSARGFSLEVLTEIYDALPLDIEISYLKFDNKGSFSVEGTAESMASVFSFVDSLGESPYFNKVETRYTRKRKRGEKDVADFALICTLDDRY